MDEGGWKRPARLPNRQCVWTGLGQGSRSSKNLFPGIASISQSLMRSRAYPSLLMDFRLKRLLSTAILHQRAQLTVRSYRWPIIPITTSLYNPSRALKSRCRNEPRDCVVYRRCEMSFMLVQGRHGNELNSSGCRKPHAALAPSRQSLVRIYTQLCVIS
jgi:hypothetical protein